MGIVINMKKLDTMDVNNEYLCFIGSILLLEVFHWSFTRVRAVYSVRSTVKKVGKNRL